MPQTFIAIRTPGPAWEQHKSMREQLDWAGHAQFMDDLFAQGFILLGGPLGTNGEIMLLIEATHEEEVRQTLERDPWSQAGLLRLESVTPWHILLDFRQKT